MSIKQEFDRDYCSWIQQHQSCSEWEAAVWAAKWMAERICSIVREYDPTNLEQEIRQLARELE